MRFNSVIVSPVRSLEVGDLIAREFLGGIISGRVTGIAHCAYELTAEQREYMSTKANLTIPDGEYEPLGGHGSCLIFGDFTESGVVSGKSHHMYVDYNVTVAVFPTKDGE